MQMHACMYVEYARIYVCMHTRASLVQTWCIWKRERKIHAHQKGTTTPSAPLRSSMSLHMRSSMSLHMRSSRALICAHREPWYALIESLHMRSSRAFICARCWACLHELSSKTCALISTMTAENTEKHAYKSTHPKSRVTTKERLPHMNRKRRSASFEP